MPFRPRLWPTFFTIPAVLAMLGLSVWQLDRLAWKTALLDSFESRVTQPPVPPPASIADIEQWRFRHVRAPGRFVPAQEAPLTGRPFRERTRPVEGKSVAERVALGGRRNNKTKKKIQYVLKK